MLLQPLIFHINVLVLSSENTWQEPSSVAMHFVMQCTGSTQTLLFYAMHQSNQHSQLHDPHRPHSLRQAVWESSVCNRSEPTGGVYRLRSFKIMALRDGVRSIVILSITYSNNNNKNNNNNNKYFTYLQQFSFQSVAVALTPVQTKQITIKM